VKTAIPDIPMKQLVKSLDHKYKTISSKATVMEALDILVNEKLPRVYVMDDSKDSKMALSDVPIGVFSPFTIVSWLANKFVVPSSANNWPLGLSKIQDLDIIKNDFPCVYPEDSCLDALHKLHSKEVNALAIINPNNSEAPEVYI
jgi:CBS domain-containing protein